MSTNQPVNEVAVDRRAETVTPLQPGDAATEAALRDAVPEERQWVLELTHSFIKNWIYDN
ncbi:hypothetical protein TFLX_02641 [Thermoflexales bacterium]|nr:hypothetical protein TFLX_02641 [Thermoflexales bacterium]